MKRPELDKFEAEALAQLALIDEGASHLTANASWGSSVIVVFTDDDGWRFAVFEDAGDWDYLEWVEAPDGRRWDFGDGWQNESEDPSEDLMDWHPDDEARWTEAEVRR